MRKSTFQKKLEKATASADAIPVRLAAICDSLDFFPESPERQQLSNAINAVRAVVMDTYRSTHVVLNHCKVKVVSR